tara:strand:- start:264 stop:638 length:375 start_codon:yes stop_codon:yes gene_type:complete
MSISPEKKFGLLFFVIFIIIGIWPLLNNDPIRTWSVSISIVFLVALIFLPSLLRILNTSWIKFGETLGKVIAPIVMASIFFFLITPLSFFIRMFGKDLLKLKFLDCDSYWIKRNKNLNTMDKQF